MSSEILDVTGTALFPQLFEHNRDRGSAPGSEFQYAEATSIELVLDQEALGLVSRALPKVKPKVRAEGIAVKFRRKWTNPMSAKLGGPPVVKDIEGNLWNPDTLIGNGSKVRVAVEVYDSKYGKQARLAGVQVIELVEGQDVSTPELPF